MKLFGRRQRVLDGLREVPLFRRQHEVVVGLYPDLQGRRLIHEVVRRMINYVVTDLVETTRMALREAASCAFASKSARV